MKQWSGEGKSDIPNARASLHAHAPPQEYDAMLISRVRIRSQCCEGKRVFACWRIALLFVVIYSICMSYGLFFWVLFSFSFFFLNFILHMRMCVCVCGVCVCVCVRVVAIMSLVFGQKCSGKDNK